MAIATIDFRRSGSRGLTAAQSRRVRDAMARDGAVAFEGLFPRPLLERVRAAVLRRLATGELFERGLIRDVAGRYAALVPFEGPLLDPAFYANPRLHAMLGALLGARYCIGSLEAVVARPGALRQHQHIDGPIRLDRVVGGRRVPYRRDLSDLPPYAVTLSIPLRDIDEESGPTAIWPGSHREALSARPPGEAAVARRYPEARMTGRFGRTFFFDYRVFHGGTPNMTREERPVLMFVFTRAWYRDPNLNEVGPRVVISKSGFARVPERRRGLFMLARAARRELWGPR